MNELYFITLLNDHMSIFLLDLSEMGNGYV